MASDAHRAPHEPEPGQQRSFDGRWWWMASREQGTVASEPAAPAGAVSEPDLPRRETGSISHGARCPTPAWFRVKCVDHESVRYVRLRCKSRLCPVCGPIGRQEIADRLAYGVRWYERKEQYTSWLVLTFPQDVSKEQATRRVARFMSSLRSISYERLEYAATYELTQAGRLHVNLLISPWTFVPHSVLYRLWGARISVTLVRDTLAAARDSAKALSPESLGAYLGKLDQSLPPEWGRRVSFSQGWPRRPERDGVELPAVWQAIFGPARESVGDWAGDGILIEVAPDIFAFKHALSEAGSCDCFDALCGGAEAAVARPPPSEGALVG